MTNSKAEKPKLDTGIEAETTQDGNEFVSDKGTVFEVRQRDNGLYFIHMAAGGASPAMCDCFYTSRALAVLELETYLRQRDRAGYAQFPNKGK